MGTLIDLVKGLWFGVLLIDGDANLIDANDSACTLLDCASQEDLRQRWKGLAAQLGLSRPNSTQGAEQHWAGTGLAIATGTRVLDFEVCRLGREPGYLVLMRERRILDPLERELLLACQMRTESYALAGLIHELADPVNAMCVALDTLKTGLEDPTPLQGGGDTLAKQQPQIVVLDASLSRLRRGIQALRAHADRRPTPPEKIDLVATIDECLQLLQRRADMRRIELRQAPPGAVAVIEGIRRDIRQAFLNVMTYAIEKMLDGGRLCVGIVSAEFEVEVILRCDTLSLPTEVLHDVSPIHDTTKNITPDPRLYLARRLAECNRGELLIDEQRDKATCFRLRFPAPPATSS